MYGHVGSKKSTKLLKEHFTFDQMTTRVQGHVKTCDMCQRCKYTNNRNLFGGTRPFIPSDKGDLISGDSYGPLPLSLIHI